MKTLFSLLNTIACQWRQYAGTLEQLFVVVPLIKNDTSSKFDFFIYSSHFYTKFCVDLSN